MYKITICFYQDTNEKVKRYTLEDELRKLEGVQYVTEKELRAPERLTAPERRKELGQSRNDSQLWMCLVVKVRYNAVKKVLYRNLEC